MAKRKKKSHGRRRRRIGALSMSASSPLVKFGSMAAGYFLADKVNEQLVKLTGTMDPKIVNGILAAGGLYYNFLYKGKKSTIMVALTGLAAGVGAKGLLTDFGVITGFREMPVIGSYGNVPVIGEYAPTSGNLSGIGAYNVPSSVLNGIGAVADASGSGVNCSDR